MLNAPVEVTAPVALFVSTPLLSNAVVPPDPKLLFTAKVVPFRSAEPNDTVSAKVVNPVAAFVCVNAPLRFTAPLNEVAPALVRVTALSMSASPVPKPEEKVVVPVPDCKVRVSTDPPSVPSTDPLKVMFPAVPDPVDRVTVDASAKVKVFRKDKSTLFVVIDVLIFAGP